MAARRTFTIRLCRRLAHALERDLGDTYLVHQEQKPDRAWPGQPDLTLTKPGSPHVVVIEVEHWAGLDQANTNVQQALSWATANPAARVALVHLINASGNVKPDRIEIPARPPANFGYFPAVYEHERHDMESTTADVLEQIAEEGGADAIHAACEFAFARPSRARAARTAPAPRVDVREGRDEYNRSIWRIFVNGEEFKYFMSEEKAVAFVIDTFGVRPRVTRA